MSDSIKSDIGKICAKAMRGQNPDALSDVLEALSSNLAFTIAVSAGGDKGTIETLVMGVEKYIFDEALRLAPVGKVTNFKAGSAE